jgi:hypothetical protein
MAIKNDDIELILAGKTTDEQTLVLEGKTANELSLILNGKTTDEQALILQGIAHESDYMRLILSGVVGVEDDLALILKGKTYGEQGIVLNAKCGNDLGIILSTVADVARKRLMLLDTLNLRTTAVYRSPREIKNLQVVYGDLTRSRIPCTPLDKDGYLYHASDLAMQLISGVYVENEPTTSGYHAYTAYQDETGHQIAAVLFDNPQYDKNVSVSGKGAIDMDTGDLIENPADLIKSVFLTIQGYDTNSIDLMEIARFYADCLREEIKTAVILDSQVTIKIFLDELAENIHAHWMLSDGKSVMRLRWL